MVVLPTEQFARELADAVAEKVLAQIKTSPLPSKEKDDEFLTTADVLRTWRISAPTWRKLRKTAKVPVYGEGTHHTRFKRTEVEAALARMNR